ncbi:hypothetical protein [[Micrococcus luteus] ATCC 49442]|uniref:hypothetical protein n=1 Tax=[Micrococcus luteus] ATCC 49442 TaxID=2698727 RepID=UPI0013DBEE5F|nr:hypothetical protein [[Micrococcus luteus] ATCC 49442]
MMADFEGVRFASRHGDDLQLWALFQHPEDPAVSSNIQHVEVEDLQHDSPAPLTTFGLLGIQGENDEEDVQILSAQPTLSVAATTPCGGSTWWGLSPAACLPGPGYVP